VVLCPDVVPCMDSRFDGRDLLQRSVIHYEAERKTSSAIIIASIQGLTTGTVASNLAALPKDRSSGLVSTQAGAFMLAASVGGLVSHLRIHQERKMSAIPPNSPIAQGAPCIRRRFFVGQ
jgi:hypothetical protein